MFESSSARCLNEMVTKKNPKALSATLSASHLDKMVEQEKLGSLVCKPSGHAVPEN
jgi:hypothetical protein